MADFVIGWRADEQRFDAAIIRAELTDRRSGLDMPLEIEQPIRCEPEGIIELVPDEETTSELAVFRAELTREVLADPDFFRKVARPVQVTITARPLSGETASMVFADSGRISRSCSVTIEAPPAQLRWRVRDIESDAPVNLAIDDQVLEVEADGQHSLELEVWVERYLPSRRRVDRDHTVEFTHKTDGSFRTRILAPHPDSRPWVVARAGSGNRRDKSVWKSNAWLPDPRHPEQVPLTGSIVVKAWEPGDILDRPGADLIRHRDGAVPIVEAAVPVRLVPVRVSGERIRPTEPVPADGSGSEVTLRLTRTRTGRLLSGAQVSWELRDGEGLPGGTVEPTGVWLTTDHGGHATFTYTPPPLTYEPGGVYAQPLRLFSGAGDHRDESASAPTLHVSPRVRARLLGTKPGLDFEPPYELDIAPSEAPEEVVVHHGFASLDPHIEGRFDVYDSSPSIAVVTADGEVDVVLDARTEVDGTYVWKLPELVEGLAARPPGPRRRMELRPFEQESAADLDDESFRLVHTYRSYLADPEVATTLSRVLDASVLAAVRDQPSVLARRLCLEPRDELAKVRYGTDIVLAAVRGTVTTDRIHANMFDRALDLAVKFTMDLAEALLRVFRLGERILAYLADSRVGQAAAAFASTIVKGLEAILPMLSRRLPSLAGLVESVIRSEALGGSAFARQVALLTQQTLDLMRAQVNLLLGHAQATAMSLLQPGKALGEGAAYAARKSADTATKALVKALAQFYTGTGPLHDIIDRVTLGRTTKADAQREAKDWVRHTLLPYGIATEAAVAMTTTTNNVGALVYDFPPSTVERYLTSIHRLEVVDTMIGNQVAALDWYTDKVSMACNVLAAITVAFAVGTWGATVPFSFTGLSAISLLKLQMNAGIHLYEAFALGAFAFFALGAYREITIGLSRRIT